MTQAELAERAGRPRKTINEIVRGQAAITPDTAIQLERVLGIPASFWNRRQQQYDESRARLEALERLRGYGEWPRNFPTSQMARHGWIPPCKTSVQKVEALLRFFGIASPKEWDQLWTIQRLGVVFRKSSSFQTNSYALCAWIRQGELQAAGIGCPAFERRNLESALLGVKDLVRDLPDGFDRVLVRRMALCGVAVAFVPLIRGVHAWGATRWIKADKAVMVFSLRGRYEDIFWFSFFHEAAHLLLHGKREAFVEETGRAESTAEKEADAFARDLLVDASLWQEFVSGRRLYSALDVTEFAGKAGVSPAIIVGRLQHEGRIDKSALNGLRRKVVFAPANNEKNG